MRLNLSLILLGISVSVIISCKQEIISEPPEEPSIKNSKLVVNSTPTGAQIYLDGKNMGIKTPDSLLWVQPGAHKLTLKLGLFPDRSYNFEIQDSSRISYYYDYHSDPGNYGGISCSSKPTSADVYFNDSLLSQKTPITINKLFPGNYKVKVTYPSHRSDSSNVFVHGGVVQNISFELEDTTVWVSYKSTNSPVTSNYITYFYIDTHGIKWFGSRDGGLFSFFHNHWNIDYKTYTVNAILKDDQDNIWVATNGSLQFYSNPDGKWYDYGKYLPSTYVTCLFIDDYKRLWIGTTRGIAIYDGVSWMYINTDSDQGFIINNYVTCITEDNMKRIWIGTKAGITMTDGRVWTNYTTAEMNLPKNIGNNIKEIRADKDGTVWIAHTENPDSNIIGGLSKFDGQNFSKVDISGFLTNRISRIWVDGNNYKWISTINGVARFKEPSDIMVLNTSNSKLPANQVTDVRVDSNGDLWIATYGGGITKLKKGNF